jgi:molybdopterin molybdotransferase
MMSEPAADPCFDRQPALLSVEDAVAALLSEARPLADLERIQLMQAGGRVLAEELRSPIDVPGFDNSAMDGYALHTSDIERAQSDGLVIAQRIPAGSTGTELQAGTAARIFTGAPLPAGADTVVMQEICRVEGDRVILEKPVTAGANIRPRGNDIRCGNTVLESGTVLQAAHLGLAASVGISEVSVYRHLKVAIFSTGDELVMPGQPLAAGQIYNSNRYQLSALLQAQGCEVIDLGSIADDFETTRRTLLDAAELADVVITTGGVSVGEEDYIKTALQAVGELTLWRIRMKPGKPLAFGRVGAVPFIGLPGNPVSTFVTFLLFARPFIQFTQGRTQTTPPSWPVQAGFDYQSKQRREYVRVRLNHDPAGLPVAETYPRQGSDVLSSVVWADGLVEIPEATRVSAGDTVRFLPFSEWAR